MMVEFAVGLAAFLAGWWLSWLRSTAHLQRESSVARYKLNKLRADFTELVLAVWSNNADSCATCYGTGNVPRHPVRRRVDELLLEVPGHGRREEGR